MSWEEFDRFEEHMANKLKVNKMQEIVINSCHGGFGLSDKALTLYKKRINVIDPKFWVHDIQRNCPTLIALVKEIGKEADTSYSLLRIVEIPDDVEWQIEEYDGLEWVAEKHRTWE
jgi:hypothetical protein